MISERLKQYIEYKEISYYSIEQNVGVANGTIAKAVKANKNIGSQIIESIIKVCPDLNPAWLIAGEGNMIRENKTIVDRENKPLKEFDLTEYIKSKDEKIEQQSIEIGMLRKEIELLKIKRYEEPESTHRIAAEPPAEYKKK